MIVIHAAMKLRYGCNPQQVSASVSKEDGNLPFSVLNGSGSFINILDALTSWQLVREAMFATSMPTAASFKHVSPAGVAVCIPGEEGELSPLARAYLKARNCDPVASFGDAVAVSGTVDVSLAKILSGLVSDLIIAPSYSDEALEILRKKKAGKYLIIQMDLDYEAPSLDKRELFGITLVQDRNTASYSKDEHLEALQVAGLAAPVASKIALNACLANITLKYTVSNSIAVATGGQVIGVSASQQSRIASTRLACGKADKWFFCKLQSS